jgi:hypothetical protein
MTRSLIRLDSIVRASLNVGLNNKAHDETRAKADINVNDISKDVVNDDEDITDDYNERDCGITDSYSE